MRPRTQNRVRHIGASPTAKGSTQIGFSVGASSTCPFPADTLSWHGRRLSYPARTCPVAVSIAAWPRSGRCWPFPPPRPDVRRVAFMGGSRGIIVVGNGAAKWAAACPRSRRCWPPFPTPRPPAAGQPHDRHRPAGSRLAAIRQVLPTPPHVRPCRVRGRFVVRRPGRRDVGTGWALQRCAAMQILSSLARTGLIL
jgi:hypothetical protein